MESIITQMELGTRENGKMTNSMEKVKKPGPMVHVTKVITGMVRKMVMANFCGLMDRLIMGPSRTITFMARVLIHGLIIEPSMAIGSIIRCMVGVYSRGQMEELMRVSTMMIKSRVKEYSHGPMADDMKDNGTMENSMAKEFTRLVRVRPRLGSGGMARE